MPKTNVGNITFSFPQCSFVVNDVTFDTQYIYAGLFYLAGPNGGISLNFTQSLLDESIKFHVKDGIVTLAKESEI